MQELGETLIVVTCPFGRTARYLLCSELFEQLVTKYKVLVVSPSSNNENFRKEFQHPNVSFVALPSSEPKALRRLFHFSESLRMHGFWYRFRKEPRLAYLWCQLIRGLFILEQAPLKFLRVFKLRVEAFLGRAPHMWQLIDDGFGKWFYDVNELSSISARFQNTIAIQTASFGYYERAVAYWIRRQGIQSIFIPYTVDQIGLNGYLLAPYTTVCPQGSVEVAYLKDFHNISDKRVFKLGSIWFRNVDRMLEGIKYDALQRNDRRSISRPRLRILYAGVSPMFFSYKSELQVVEGIGDAITKGGLVNCELIYRTLLPQNILSRLKDRFSSVSQITFDVPDPSVVGIDQFGTNAREAAKVLIALFQSVDVLVMSGFTSLCLDMFYLGKPVISFYDPSSEMYHKAAHKMMLQGDCFNLMNHIKVCHTKSEVIETLCSLANDVALSSNHNNEVGLKWDCRDMPYPTAFLEHLESCIAEKASPLNAC